MHGKNAEVVAYWIYLSIIILVTVFLAIIFLAVISAAKQRQSTG